MSRTAPALGGAVRGTASKRLYYTHTDHKKHGSIEGDDTDVVGSTGCTGRFSREGSNNTDGAMACVTHSALSWARAC